MGRRKHLEGSLEDEHLEIGSVSHGSNVGLVAFGERVAEEEVRGN